MAQRARVLALEGPITLLQRGHAPPQAVRDRHRDRKADLPLIQKDHQSMIVERAVGAQIDLVNALRKAAKRPLDDPPVAARSRDMAIAELVPQDYVLLRPERHHRLVAAPPVIGRRRRALAGREDRRVDVDRRHALGRALLQVGNHRPIGQTQSAQGQALLADRRLAGTQQGQLGLLEADQEIARRLRRWQIMTQQKRQTVTAA